MVRCSMHGSIETSGWTATLLEVTTIELDPAPIAPPGALGDRVVLPLNLVLLRGHGRTLLVDGGFGPFTHIIPGTVEDLDASLAAAGVSRGAIDTILLSHGDFDHIGGLAAGEWPDALVPGFPGARVACPALVAEHYRDRDPDEEGNIATRILATLRGAGLLDEVPNGAEVAPGVRLTLAAGHAPGHSVVELGDYVHCVDVLHHEEHFPHPEWDAGFDQDASAALATRHAWIDQLAADGRRASFAHLTGFGRVERDGASHRWAPLA